MVNALTWLNKKFVENIVQNSKLKNEMTRVLDISVITATAKGDNYCSDILRITIEFIDRNSEKQRKSIIFKLAPQIEGVQKTMIMQGGVFNTEISMMTNTLEKMHSLIKSSNRFSSTVYYTQTEDPVFLVLEDLSLLGFRMSNQSSGLDMEHSLLAIDSLAKFHAASVALCEKEPDQKLLYTRGMFTKSLPPEFGCYFNNTIKALAKEVAKWPDAKKYASKLTSLSLHAYDSAISATAPKEKEFNVINHGDYWSNNMLFRYENDKPVEYMMVDFQLSYYSSPVLDLLHFINTSVSDEIYHNKTDMLLKAYHETLFTTMKNLGCRTSPPTINDLQKSMKQRAIVGVICGLTILPVLLFDKSKVKDIDEIMPGDDQVVEHPAFKSDIFRQVLTKRLPLFDADGLLN